MEKVLLSQVAKLSLATAAFLGGAIFLGAAYAMTEVYSLYIGSGFFAWLGGIQVLNSLAPRLPTPMARTIHWTHAMTFECLAYFPVIFLHFVPSREKISGKGKPILLVHGYLNHSSVWTFQKRKFEKGGFGPIYTITLRHPFRSIRTYAEKVKIKAEAIAAETGRKDLILIGHSMGGLVSSLYATTLAAPGTVTDVITIGSPFVGTPMARIALGQNAREMEPNSPFLQQLLIAMAKNRQIRFHHIATKTDQLVIPGQSAVIKENPHFIYEDIGHAGLLYSTRVADKISEWLR